MTDAYTRVVLTVIALALVTIAVQLTGGLAPAALADGPTTVRFERPVEVRVVSVEAPSRAVPVEVAWKFATAGSSSGNPLYVQTPR